MRAEATGHGRLEALEFLWLLKEQLGRNGEELARVRRAVPAQRRPRRPRHEVVVELLAVTQWISPEITNQHRCAVGDNIEHVQLMCEHVQNDVRVGLRAVCPGKHLVPGQHDWPAARLRQPGDGEPVHADRARRRSRGLTAGVQRRWVDDQAPDAAVVVVVKA